MDLDWALVDKLIRTALEEDLGDKGDITTRALFADTLSSVKALLICHDLGVLAGVSVAERAFCLFDSEVRFKALAVEGSKVGAEEVIAEIRGQVQSILGAERTALNFLAHLSGIATLTNALVEEVKPYGVEILDTRKTTPGLRCLEKYAVRVGGGFNHRQGLFDGVLIKDNHIKAIGGIKKALQLIRKNLSSETEVEVETENLAQVKEGIEAGADVIMLDNVSIEQIRKAMTMVEAGGHTKFEASGGIDFKSIKEVAKTGVDYISLGSITQSAPALDISLELVG